MVMAALTAGAASVQFLRAHDVGGALRAELHRVGDAQQLVSDTRRADAERRAGRTGA